MTLQYTTITKLLALIGVPVLLATVGASTAFFGPMAGITAIAFAGSAILLMLLKFDQSNSRNWMFVIAFVVPFFLAIFLKLTRIPLFGPWQIALLVLSLFGVREFLHDVKQERLLQWFLAIFAIFIIWGVFSTLFGRSHLYPATYQLISDFKPLLAVVLGYALIWDLRMERVLWFVVRWFWIPAMALVLFEWLAPSAYFNIFPGGAGRISTDPSGMFPSRALGIFEHPSFLASAAASFLILTVSRALMVQENRLGSWFLSAIYFLLILFAVQRQELAACLIAAFLVYLLARPERLPARLAIVSVLSVIAVAAFWTVFAQNITREMALWGIGTLGPIEHPRAQIFTSAWFLANEYFPLGSGLGTFAGAGAEKFDTSLYENLGFRNYWWYGKEDFLMDTYWPNSIAETGFIGASMLFSSYLLLLAYAIKRCVQAPPASRRYWASAAALMAYMLLLSFTSPAFQDLRLFVLPALLFGIASKVSKEARHANS